jgi:hypothetical protein
MPSIEPAQIMFKESIKLFLKDKRLMMNRGPIMEGRKNFSGYLRFAVA